LRLESILRILSIRLDFDFGGDTEWIGMIGQVPPHPDQYREIWTEKPYPCLGAAMSKVIGMW
jgi:hypothetical protein